MGPHPNWPTWDFSEMGTTTRMGRGPSAGEHNNEKRLWAMEREGGERRRRTRRYATSNIVGGKVEREREIKELGGGEMMTVSVFSFVPLSVHCLLPPPSWATGKWGVFLVWSPLTTDEAKRKHYRRCGKIVGRSVLPVCVLP